MKRVEELIKDIEVVETRGKVELLKGWITGVTEDSRQVKPGYIFVAKHGTKQTGEKFIPDAIKRGATVVVRESPCENSELFENVLQIRVRNTREALSRLVLRFFDEPQKRLTLIGITGTNGKTSVSYFLKEFLRKKGIKTGYIGTLCYEIDKVYKALHTTPPIETLSFYLSEMVKRGFSHCVMEVSSHALSQERVCGLEFDACVFTNLSPEHLDYHSDLEDYYQAKKRLFLDYAKKNAVGVISLETEWGKRLAEEVKPLFKNLILTNTPEFCVKKIKDDLLEVRIFGKVFKVSSGLSGYQLKNLATVCGVLLGMGFPLEEVIEGIQTLSPPEGRLEKVAEYKGAKFFVDYAHTPDALKEAILSVRDFAKNRVIVVFGCGGDRDKHKRAPMGEIATTLADYAIVTSDNPRTEPPEAIIEDILKGIKGKNYEVVVDRKEAIKRAVSIAEEGDVILVAGKGHEDYQEIQGKRIPFSDRLVILEATSERKGCEHECGK